MLYGITLTFLQANGPYYWTVDMLKNMWDINVKTTEVVVEAIKNTSKPPEVFVNMSSCCE